MTSDERRDRGWKAVKLEFRMGPAPDVTRGRADWISRVVKELKCQVRSPRDLTAQAPSFHDEQCVLRGLLTTHNRCSDGRPLIPSGRACWVCVKDRIRSPRHWVVS